MSRYQPPSILLLVLDTARARNFSCYGHHRKTTPVIDRLADKHVQYSDAVTASPWTLPSHSTLFTGVYPSVHRTNSLESRLPEDLVTLSQILSDEGYRTVGMASNPWFSSEFGITRGFDKFFQMFGPYSTDSYREFSLTLTDDTKSFKQRLLHLLHTQTMSDLCKNSLNAGYRMISNRPDDGAAEAVKKTISLISGPSPFFGFINFLEPHLPYDPPEAYADQFLPQDVDSKAVKSVNQYAPTYNIRNVSMDSQDFDILERLYEGALRYVDDRIGKIFSHLREEEEMDNTMIIIMGDHGENIGDHGLMGHHYSVHQTLLHIPLIIKYPNSDGQGVVVNERVSSIDVPATIAQVLHNSGIPINDFMSQQMGEPLTQTAERSDPIIVEYLNHMPSIGQLKEKCNNPGFDVEKYDRQLWAIFDNNQKVIVDSNGYIELYNVASDPNERNDLADDFPERASSLRNSLQEYRNQLEPTGSHGRTKPKGDIEDRLNNLGYL